MTTFNESTTATWEESSIHAEVQLLVYCERYLHGLKPRVICSSKKACFLCNALINTHGKVYTPYSHGRVYPRWRLPKIPGDQLAERLSGVLLDRSRRSLRQMQTENKRIRHPPPDESANHTLLLSTTTLAEPDCSPEQEQDEPIDAQQLTVVPTNSGALEKLYPSANGDGPTLAGEPQS